MPCIADEAHGTAAAFLQRGSYVAHVAHAAVGVMTDWPQGRSTGLSRRGLGQVNGLQLLTSATVNQCSRAVLWPGKSTRFHLRTEVMHGRNAGTLLS